MSKFDYSEDPGPELNDIKCIRCGHTTAYCEDTEWRYQSDCKQCRDHDGSMLGYGWGGWKLTPERDAYFKKEEKDRKQREAAHKIEQQKPEFQYSEPFHKFSKEERTIAKGLLVVEDPGTEAPWLGAFGACFVKVYGIRRAEDGTVEFGVGEETPPISAWVKADDFYGEWPD